MTVHHAVNKAAPQRNAFPQTWTVLQSPDLILIQQLWAELEPDHQAAPVAALWTPHSEFVQTFLHLSQRADTEPDRLARQRQQTSNQQVRGCEQEVCSCPA